MGVDLVITTGGTGFGVRDVTPEAVAPLIHRPTPALTHAITSSSLQKTPLAALSRQISGIRTKSAGASGSLIITLPGSKKAVSECLDVLLDNGVLLHALELCTGKGSGSQTHAAATHDRHSHGTETDTGKAHTQSHSHHHHPHHHHHHHAPRPRTTQQQRDEAAQRYLTPYDASSSQAIALRARQSPYPIVDLDDALRLIAQHTPESRDIVELPVDASLIGHVLAQDITAPRSLPPTATTNVDGYAVLAAQTPEGEYQVVTPGRGSVMHGKQVCRINTGQALPQGTDAVVMVEDTHLLATHELPDGRTEESRLRVLAQVEAGENVRPAASDVQEGKVVLRAGTTITSLGGEVGTLAFLGLQRVKVFKKPRVAILSTGEELRDIHAQNESQPGTAAWSHSSFDTNRPSLMTSLHGLGYSVLDLGIVGDDPPTALLEAMRRGVAEADVLITTGGTSMGESDWVKPLLERSVGGTNARSEIHFGRVSMKPGKPTTFATIGDGKHGAKKVVFALPGNPASALVCFYVFVLPALRKMQGVERGTSAADEQQQQHQPNPWSLPHVRVSLAHSLPLDSSRPEFHRVSITTAAIQRRTLLPQASVSSVLVATSTGKQRSSGMHSMSCANGLVVVPSKKQLSDAGQKDVRELASGQEAWAMLLGSLEM